jgi:hypothetical protein
MADALLPFLAKTAKWRENSVGWFYEPIPIIGLVYDSTIS